jgi:hypothetical protein
MVLGGLPLTINNSASYLPDGDIVISSAGTSWPAGRTSLVIEGVPNTTTALVISSGSAVGASVVQIANTSANIRGTLIYRV